MRSLAITALLALLSLPALAQMGAGNQPRDVFSNFDDDRNGVMTRREALAGGILDRFDQMDRNRDGEVTEPEFNAMDAPGIETDTGLGEEPGDEAELEPRGPTFDEEGRAEYWISR